MATDMSEASFDTVLQNVELIAAKAAIIVQQDLSDPIQSVHFEWLEGQTLHFCADIQIPWNRTGKDDRLFVNRRTVGGSIWVHCIKEQLLGPVEQLATLGSGADAIFDTLEQLRVLQSALSEIEISKQDRGIKTFGFGSQFGTSTILKFGTGMRTAGSYSPNVGGYFNVVQLRMAWPERKNILEAAHSMYQARCAMPPIEPDREWGNAEGTPTYMELS